MLSEKMCVLVATLEPGPQRQGMEGAWWRLWSFCSAWETGGAADVLWTQVWRMQRGVLIIVLKMDHKRRNWSHRTLCRRWWGSGPGVAVIVDKILEEETQKSLEKDWFSMSLCVHTYTGTKDDAQVWGLCDHLDEVVLWGKVLFGF